MADPHDYESYRRTRTLPTLEERLHAAELYLDAHPAGAFVADVQRAYARAEEALWVSKKGSVAGLRAYLEEMPRGPHAAQARRELDERLAASVDVMGRRAAETEVRLAAAAAERSRAREELGAWLRRFGDPGVFGAPLVSAPGELVAAWSLALPAPRCEPDERSGGRRCRKLVERPFSIPAGAAGGGGRVMVLEIAVEEDAEGRVCAVSFAGPALFSRFEEADALQPADRAPMRAQAVLAASLLVRSSIEVRQVGGEPCRSEPAGEGGTQLTCDDLRVAMRASTLPGGDDVVRISRASSCSGP